jgi:hypothetical protein
MTGPDGEKGSPRQMHGYPLCTAEGNPKQKKMKRRAAFNRSRDSGWHKTASPDEPIHRLREGAGELPDHLLYATALAVFPWPGTAMGRRAFFSSGSPEIP